MGPLRRRLSGALFLTIGVLFLIPPIWLFVAMSQGVVVEMPTVAWIATAIWITACVTTIARSLWWLLGFK